MFYEGFSVDDIAEPLVSFDATRSVEEVRASMEARAFEVVGARRDGLVVGYLERSELTSGTCEPFIHPFDPSEIVPSTQGLADIVEKLNTTPRIFVTFLGHVCGIVTRSDLQKPPVRMWLFGMITLIEMRMAKLIESLAPGDQWKAFLSNSRLQKAEVLLAERTRRNQNLGLLDCLQFSDKGQIIARNPAIRAATRFESRRQIEKVVKLVERLRNNLAHSQDIITSNWDAIVLLASDLDDILNPQALQRDLPSS